MRGTLVVSDEAAVRPSGSARHVADEAEGPKSVEVAASAERRALQNTEQSRRDGRQRPARFRFWTTREIAFVLEHYPRIGPEGCARELCDRTEGAIAQKAAQLKVKPPNGTFSRHRWPNDERIDAQIRLVYQSRPSRGIVNDLARRLMRPRWWVIHRAADLGLVVPRFRPAEWCEAEQELLAAHAHKSPGTIQRIFRAHGFRRTVTAIVVKRKRFGGSRALHPDHYSAYELAQLFGVDGKTITRWIAVEGLPARRRGTARTPQQGGDTWSISRRSLRTWIANHAQLVDLRKVDRYWFIDLMTGKSE